MALFRMGAEKSDEMIEAALASDDPLAALWDFFVDASRVQLALEFMALANHRKEIRAEIAAHSERMRARQVAALERIIGKRIEGISAEGLSLVLAGIGRALVMEGGLGVSLGHADARRFVEDWLARLTPSCQEAVAAAAAR
jgi:hypothetical protein